MRGALTFALALSSFACGSHEFTDAEIAALQPTYARDVRPIFERSCVPCHTSDGLRAGGVELDRYESAFSARVKNACVSLTPALVDRFSAVLQPEPRDPPSAETATTCADWEAFSMPPDAFDRLTPHEQLVLARWVELGAPR